MKSHDIDEQLAADDGEFVPSMLKMAADIKKAAETLTPKEARFLVERYYDMQHARLVTANQTRALGDKPHEVLTWLSDKNRMLEDQVKGALDIYSRQGNVGKWLRAQHGLGPVISAGLLAHLSVNPWRCHKANMDGKLMRKPCPEGDPCTVSCGHRRLENVGHWWSFAGVGGEREWKKGELRPWNADLKQLLWKLGESFIKQSSNDKCFYGHLWVERKTLEVRWNDEGKNRESALVQGQKVDKKTDAWLWNNGCYPAGTHAKWIALEDLKARAQFLETQRLPPGQGLPMLAPLHIHNRARRFTVKLFLSHMFEVAYRDKWGVAPPEPYPIRHLGHADKIPVPG